MVGPQESGTGPSIMARGPTARHPPDQRSRRWLRQIAGAAVQGSLLLALVLVVGLGWYGYRTASKVTIGEGTFAPTSGVLEMGLAATAGLVLLVGWTTINRWLRRWLRRSR